MGAHLRETILALPALEWDAEQYIALFDQLDEEGHDERTRVRELLGIAAAKGTALHTLRVGELKAMLALAAGDLESALDLIDWTMEFNQSVFPADRAAYYRALRACVELFLDEERDPEPVSYTHLDVYKRQCHVCATRLYPPPANTSASRGTQQHAGLTSPPGACHVGAGVPGPFSAPNR